MTQRLSIAELAKTLVTHHFHGVLSTIATDGGYPYGSVIDYVPLSGGDVVILLNEKAEHYRYLRADPKASLLINAHLAEHEALHVPRVTLLGDARVLEDTENLAERYLELHPDARDYIDQSVLHFFQLDVTGVRYIAGAGRVIWLEPADYRAAMADPLGNVAPWVIHEVNSHHAEDLVSVARKILGERWAESCQVVAIDRFGFDMVCFGADRRHAVRVSLDEEASDDESFKRQVRKVCARAVLMADPEEAG